MKFEEAFELMRQGKNVRRKNSYIRLHHINNEFVNQNCQRVEITPHDVFIDDWELVE